MKNDNNSLPNWNIINSQLFSGTHRYNISYYSCRNEAKYTSLPKWHSICKSINISVGMFIACVIVLGGEPADDICTCVLTLTALSPADHYWPQGPLPHRCLIHSSLISQGLIPGLSGRPPWPLASVGYALSHTGRYSSFPITFCLHEY